MAWNNSVLELYHGCTDEAARKIQGSNRYKNNINLKLGRDRVDFGRGFYTTTRHDQAENWANCQYARNRKNSKVQKAAVLIFRIDREKLASLINLGFVVEGDPQNSDFWDLVNHCRSAKRKTHERTTGSTGGFYDVVSGPVALPFQKLVVKDCDQYSFHTRDGVDALGHPDIETPKNGTFF